MSAACTYRQPFADVSGVKPAVCVQRLGRPLRVFEVALEHVWSLHTNLDGRLEKSGKGSRLEVKHLNWICCANTITGFKTLKG